MHLVYDNIFHFQSSEIIFHQWLCQIFGMPHHKCWRNGCGFVILFQTCIEGSINNSLPNLFDYSLMIASKGLAITMLDFSSLRQGSNWKIYVFPYPVGITTTASCPSRANFRASPAPEDTLDNPCCRPH